MTERCGDRDLRVGGRKGWVLAIALALLAAGVPGTQAADEPEPAPADPTAAKLEFEAMPYAWVPGAYGSITVKGTTVRVDVGTGDVLELLFDGDAFAAAGYFSLSYDRFSIFADSMGGYAEVSVAQTIPTPLCCTLTIDAKDKMKFALTDVGLGYRLGRWSLPRRRRPFTLDVYAGARVVYLSNELDAKAGVIHGAQRAANVYDSVDWADPLIGVRWSAPLLDNVSLDFRGDIGGFGTSSDLTWGLVGTLRLWLSWKPFDLNPYVAAGYRVLALDRPTKAGGGTVDLQMRGPVLGAGFVF